MSKCPAPDGSLLTKNTYSEHSEAASITQRRGETAFTKSAHGDLAGQKLSLRGTIDIDDHANKILHPTDVDDNAFGDDVSQLDDSISEAKDNSDDPIWFYFDDNSDDDDFQNDIDESAIETIASSNKQPYEPTEKSNSDSTRSVIGKNKVKNENVSGGKQPKKPTAKSNSDSTRSVVGKNKVKNENVSGEKHTKEAVAKSDFDDDFVFVNESDADDDDRHVSKKMAAKFDFDDDFVLVNENVSDSDDNSDDDDLVLVSENDTNDRHVSKKTTAEYSLDDDLVLVDRSDVDDKYGKQPKKTTVDAEDLANDYAQMDEEDLYSDTDY
ncbi:MAG: hypothetical protein LBB18_00760 [Puniceicoccales bacterium]|jgi:hypothetical protein|nr:hypothetical protein [Puniceicoccales bacterium]